MFQNLRVSYRLGLGFGLVILLTLATCVAGLTSLMSLNERVDALARSHAPGVLYAGEWHAQLEASAKDMRGLFLVPEEDLLEEIQNIRSGAQERTRLQGELQKVVTAPRAKAALGELEPVRKAYLAMEDEFLELASAGKLEEARDHLLNRSRRPQLQYIVALRKLNGILAEDALAMADASAATFRRSMQVMVGVTALAALLGTLFAIKVTRSITLPVREAVAAARRVASGDLTLRMQAGSRDELGHLLKALQEMADQLRGLVGEVAGGARSVADTSAQIAHGNIDLSQRTEEQAGTLEETASSMEQLTSTVAQNADNARQASVLAVGASDVARKGGEVVAQVVTTMNGISDASRRIADIIGVIDGIAFQTNILALNAAVEAARAGEQGRGFAVVAAEVRSLAQRSAAAAKEIKGLIGNSVEQVQAGTRLVGSAGRTMDDIVGAVKQVSDLIAEIAAASQEQSAGIGQVNSAVTQMEHVVQQNASLVEEASAATESMKEQATSLLRLVSRFRLDEDAAEQAQAVPVPTAFQGAAAAPAAVPARTPAAPALALRPPRRSAPEHAGNWSAAHSGAVQSRGDWREF